MDYLKEHVEAFEKEVVMHTSPMMRLKGYIDIIIFFFFPRYVELSKTFFAINIRYLLQSLCKPEVLDHHRPLDIERTWVPIVWFQIIMCFVKSLYPILDSQLHIGIIQYC